MSDTDIDWAYSRLTDQLYDFPSLEEVPNYFIQDGDVWIDIKHSDGQMIIDETNTRTYNE